jgi:hypothetical protein
LVVEFNLITFENKLKHMDKEKQFVGRVFGGKFHDAESTHLKLLLTGEDLSALIKLGKEAKAAKESGQALPLGTQLYQGNVQIKLEIKSSQSGNLFCEVDTYVKPEGQAAKAEKKTVEAEVIDDDLPF